MDAIVIQNLSKTYHTNIKALDTLNLNINEGEIFGLLGPNGAGKTTAVKLLTALLTPSSGSCEIYGMSTNSNMEAIHKISGVLSEHSQMYDHMSGFENLLFYSELFDMKKEDGKKQALFLLDQLQLFDAKDQKLATYSTGMRQRLSLARTMLHKPKILFLDEPTSGLDPESIVSVNKMIKELARKQGVTVFLCTHQLRYAQDLCDRFGLIDKGVLFAHGSFKDLQDNLHKPILIRIKTNMIPKSLQAIKKAENSYEFYVQNEQDIASIVKEIVFAGGEITHLSTNELSLEDLYFSLLESYREKGRKFI